MIAYLAGTILERHKNHLVLLTQGGIGYSIFVAPQTLAALSGKKEAALHTYLRVTDQSHDLYGFLTLEERNFFTLLLTVSGIGPKSALHVLGLGSVETTMNAIRRGDAAYLSAVQGVGKKTAERMVVELKAKVGAAGSGGTAIGAGVPNGSILADVIDGLTAMGYSKEEAKDAAAQLETADKTAEMLLREALQMMK